MIIEIIKISEYQYAIRKKSILSPDVFLDFEEYKKTHGSKIRWISPVNEFIYTYPNKEYVESVFRQVCNRNKSSSRQFSNNEIVNRKYLSSFF